MHSKKSKIDYSEYIQSDEWKFKSKAMRWIAGYRCQLCNSNNNTLDTHHRTYDNLGNETPSDLIVLCRDCHSKFHEDELSQHIEEPAHNQIHSSKYFTIGWVTGIDTYKDEIGIILEDIKSKLYIILEHDKYFNKINVGQDIILIGSLVTKAGGKKYKRDDNAFLIYGLYDAKNDQVSTSYYSYIPLDRMAFASTMQSYAVEGLRNASIKPPTPA